MSDRLPLTDSRGRRPRGHRPGRRVVAGAVALLTVLSALAALSAPSKVGAATRQTGTADPAADETVVTDAPSTAFTSSVVGDGNPIEVAPGGTATVAIPVAPGTALTDLTTVLEIGAPPGTGVLRVRANDTLVSVFDASSLRSGRQPLSVPLTGIAPDSSGNVVVTVDNLLRAPATEASCSPSLLPQVRLTDPVVGVSGVATNPTTVASYFGPHADRVTFITPADPDPDTAAATLSAVASMAARYRDARVVVSPGATPTTFTPGQLTVVVRPDTATAGSEVRLTADPTGALYVAVTGPPAALGGALESLATPQVALATTARAVDAGTDRGTAPYGVSIIGINELAGGPVTLSGTGTMTRSVTVSADAFGSAVSAATVHLVAAHNPIVNDQSGTVSVSWNGQLLASRDLAGEPADRITVDAAVPSSLMKRDNTLTISLAVTGVDGICSGGDLPFTLSVGDDATVTTTPGWSIAPGFDRWPQAAAGQLAVSFPRATPTAVPSADLATAGQLISALADTAAATLTVRVDDWTSFAGSATSGLVVGADSRTAPTIGAPLSLESLRRVDVDSTIAGFGVDQPYGALQAYAIGDRNLLVAGFHDDDAQMVALADEVADAATRWRSLTGAVRVKVAGQTGVDLDGARWQPPAATAATDGGRPIPQWLWAVLAAIALVVAARWWLNRRRRHRLAAEAARSRRSYHEEGTEPDGPGSRSRPTPDGDVDPRDADPDADVDVDVGRDADVL